ncbi:alkylhydroperoxidase [Halorientalis sp. IM1011]|uniref:peroxidase-related enzyme n=1 Tax=Halorientalis sp. IM1011 TaxID=1932360 RepID=UPI00097CCE2A|nr:peroxidase-related enzyme [Halorientalis sp. IM1011]AQL41301.1 alkylhydroperoxidase [Halorientalis sp. IM1011]
MPEDIEAMTRFEVPDVADLPEDLQERIEEETERAGFTPNVFLALGYRPKQARAFIEYHDALLEETALEREEIEMLIVTVSGVNDCLYCIVAHGALCRIYADDPHLAEQLAANHRTANVNDAHRAMLDFAVKLTEEPERIADEDLQRLRDHGFSQEAIWDIGNVVSFYNLSNRMAHLADMRPNEEFYTLGR